jgi:hypothetical protein
VTSTLAGVGADVDPAADRGRVDRVVVGVEADVVVARQPGRQPPADHRRDRRQRDHGGPVRVDPIRRCGRLGDFADPGAGGQQQVDDVGEVVGVPGAGLAGCGLLPGADRGANPVEVVHGERFDGAVTARETGSPR